MVLALLDQTLLLVQKPGTVLSSRQKQELKAFISFSAAKTALCSRNLEELFSAGEKRTGQIMDGRRQSILSIGKGNRSLAEFEEKQEWKLPQLYELLKTCESPRFRVPPFEPFYLDFSHRMRHESARAAVLFCGDRMAAAAFSTAYTDEMGILTVAAVAPEYRGLGLGKQVVYTLCRMLPSQNICVYRDKEENQRFYASLGFRDREPFTEVLL